ncbi:hypothetical protein NLJ89_g4184 [Agrocybe chaxingu]|uniref:Polysaccharide lyase family 8 protein n=1 Tax=Agrocybe chaxingu TaxID=84603 RepID=A0A9W8K3K1_9AGAR|nr:hypothetical protein NLJ89_g4184 [Agrocybe chaxingu]
MQTRRVDSVLLDIKDTAFPLDIPAWLSSLDSDGKWPDNEVDYTTGCAARRANWPAQTHWLRILNMANAWYGGIDGNDEHFHDANLRAAISRAMDYWFSRDFTNPACLGRGGRVECPCDNADNTLWNTNWFSNTILIPELSIQTCLLLNDTLSVEHLNNCTRISLRAYDTFEHGVSGLFTLSGANILDVGRIGIDQGLLTRNVSLLDDAYRRAHLELGIKDEIKSDGIRADGSFGQHSGMLYNGNYGKDYVNAFLDIEIVAAGTRFAAGSDSQDAFSTLFEGNKWMIFRNAITSVLHWDFSALGRFLTFPVVDDQATGRIKIDLGEVLTLGEEWSSKTLIDFANDLSVDTTDANAGSLTGNRMFYANDYMVHRGRNYVTTLKMYSTRTLNSECVNAQNPKGFHLSDGVLYTYLQGNEYEDIAAAWDWDLIPGITVDYQATPLDCATILKTGIESFVGGVSDSTVGIGVMRYTTPSTQALHFQKAWFFLEDDVQHIAISQLSSTTSAPVFSVLDQKRFAGSLIVDGAPTIKSTSSATAVKTLWHGNVGYTFNELARVSLEVGEKMGDWSAIGISTQPPATVNLFSARIEHGASLSPTSYTAFPGTTHDTFIQKANRLRLQEIRNDANISAVYDETHRTAMAVFWSAEGGSVVIKADLASASIKVTSDGNAAVIYRLDSGQVTLADPTQSLRRVHLSFDLGIGRKPPHWGVGRTKNLVFELPTGGIAGKSVTQTLD